MKEDPAFARYKPKQGSWSYQSNGIFNDLMSGRDYPERRVPVKEALTWRSSKRGQRFAFVCGSMVRRSVERPKAGARQERDGYRRFD